LADYAFAIRQPLIAMLISFLRLFLLFAYVYALFARRELAPDGDAAPRRSQRQRQIRAF